MRTTLVDQPNHTAPDVTEIIVGYNTQELMLAAVRALLDSSSGLAMRVLVFDNAPHEGKAKAIVVAFPQIEVIASPENTGFAAGINRAEVNAGLSGGAATFFVT